MHRGGRRLDHHAERRRGRRCRSPRAPRRARARTARSSATLGDHRHHDPALAGGLDRAGSRATGSSSRSGRARPTRTPRRPSAGFSSGGDRQIGRGLVAADVERADDQRPAAQRVGDAPDSRRPARPRRARVSRSRNRNSVRSRPQPSAPSATARRGVVDRAEIGEHLDPRAVARAAGFAARAASARRGGARACGERGLRGGERRRRRGRRAAGRRSASRISGVPSAIASERRARPRPASGTPIAAARIATCEVGPPRSAQKPGDRARGRAPCSCDGSRSSASRIAPGGNARRRRVVAGEQREHLALEVEQVVGALGQARVGAGRASASACGADRGAPGVGRRSRRARSPLRVVASSSRDRRAARDAPRGSRARAGRARRAARRAGSDAWRARRRARRVRSVARCLRAVIRRRRCRPGRDAEACAGPIARPGAAVTPASAPSTARARLAAGDGAASRTAGFGRLRPCRCRSGRRSRRARRRRPAPCGGDRDRRRRA